MSYAPNPFRVWSPEHRPSEYARELFCAKYDRCLGVASDGDWQDFSCHRCNAYKPEGPQVPGRDTHWDAIRMQAPYLSETEAHAMNEQMRRKFAEFGWV